MVSRGRRNWHWQRRWEKARWRDDFAVHMGRTKAPDVKGATCVRTARSQSGDEVEEVDLARTRAPSSWE